MSEPEEPRGTTDHPSFASRAVACPCLLTRACPWWSLAASSCVIMAQTMLFSGGYLFWPALLMTPDELEEFKATEPGREVSGLVVRCSRGVVSHERH